MRHLNSALYYFLTGILVVLFSCHTKTTEKESNQDQSTPPTSELQSTEKPEAGNETDRSRSGKPENESPSPPSLMVISSDTILDKWIRPDGNYMLEVREIKENGQLEAAYYNPSPINISVAELKGKNPPEIYVEFDDENYRGSYYDLEYDPANDILRGLYFQASYGQTYQIAFIRMEE